MKQNVLGRKTEKEVAEGFFKTLGYWAFLVPKSINGQPVDLIATKGSQIWFCDIKHLEENKASFSFDRIEDNQKTSLKKLYNVKTQGYLGFIIYWERENKLFYFKYEDYIDYVQKGLKSVKISNLVPLEEVVDGNNN